MDKNVNHNSAAERMTDEELEANLKVYADKLGNYAIGRLVFVGVMAVFGILGCLKLISDGITVAGVVCGFIGVAVFHSLHTKEYKVYSNYFQEHRGAEMEEIRTAYLGPNLEEPTQQTAERLDREMRESEIIADYDRSSFGDYRKGVRSGLVFEAFNVKLLKDVEVETEGEGGEPEEDTKTETVFKGIWVICDVEKDLTEKEKQQLLLLDVFADANTSIVVKNGRLYIAIETEKEFNVLTGEKTATIEDMRNNLRTSMKYVGDIIEKLAE